MPDDIFRIVVTVAVGIAALAFVVQAAILFAMYRTTRKMQESTSRLMGKIEPAVQRVGPALDRFEPFLEKVGPAIDRMGSVVDRVGPLFDKAGPAIERIGPMADKIGVLAERASAVAATTNRVIDETRPRIAQISSETVSLVSTAREQVEHFGEILHDAGDRARVRLEQVDKAVDNTVEQVENVSEAMKRAVMRPVKEVNGLAAGISAAVSTLVRGQRKSSVDAATQDEEMFI
jgi:methyl-accepting chemotaxis protein